MLPRRPLRRSSSSTTHVSDSEPEREAQRRRCDSSQPSPSRPPLAAIQNHPQRPPRAHQRCQAKISALESRVRMLERELGELKQQWGHSANPAVESHRIHSPPTTPRPSTSSIPNGDQLLQDQPHLRQLLDETFQSMKASDPTLYLLPTPVRSPRTGVTRRLGHRPADV
ncbi:hypothetical protein C8F01DRAFT_1160103 [Mycena amicta]|nr:hypothetical protein C8F01DRAFT_1160103 [Mycena amicta]